MQPEVSVLWVGHATVLLDVDGFRMLTDPILTSRVVHLRRRVPPPQLDGVDVVLISHLHMDHLHLRSLRTVVEGVRVVAPRGSAKLFRSLPVAHLDEVVDGDVVTLRAASESGPAIEARVVEADHSNSRGPHSRLVADPVGYIVSAGDRAVYFAGDTDLFDGMAELGPGIDLALLPIWGWGTSIGPGHLDPERAARAAALIAPRIAVPIHWGTLYPLGLARLRPAPLREPGREFVARMAELAPRVEARVPAPGEAVSLT